MKTEGSLPSPQERKTILEDVCVCVCECDLDQNINILERMRF